jgi:hypothetical protein
MDSNNALKVQLCGALCNAADNLGLSTGNQTVNPSGTWHEGGPCGVMSAWYNRSMAQRALDTNFAIPNLAPFNDDDVEFAYLIHQESIATSQKSAELLLDTRDHSITP